MITMATAVCISIYTSTTKVKGKFVIGTNYNPTVLQLKNYQVEVEYLILVFFFFLNLSQK